MAYPRPEGSGRVDRSLAGSTRAALLRRVLPDPCARLLQRRLARAQLSVELVILEPLEQRSETGTGRKSQPQQVLGCYEGVVLARGFEGELGQVRLPGGAGRRAGLDQQAQLGAAAERAQRRRCARASAG